MCGGPKPGEFAFTHGPTLLSSWFAVLIYHLCQLIWLQGLPDAARMEELVQDEDFNAKLFVFVDRAVQMGFPGGQEPVVAADAHDPCCCSTIHPDDEPQHIDINNPADGLHTMPLTMSDVAHILFKCNTHKCHRGCFKWKDKEGKPVCKSGFDADCKKPLVAETHLDSKGVNTTHIVAVDHSHIDRPRRAPDQTIRSFTEQLQLAHGSHVQVSQSKFSLHICTATSQVQPRLQSLFLRTARSFIGSLPHRLCLKAPASVLPPPLVSHHLHLTCFPSHHHPTRSDTIRDLIVAGIRNYEREVHGAIGDPDRLEWLKSSRAMIRKCLARMLADTQVGSPECLMYLLKIPMRVMSHQVLHSKKHTPS
jgi:hypothetical protein